MVFLAAVPEESTLTPVLLGFETAFALWLVASGFWWVWAGFKRVTTGTPKKGGE